MSGISYILIRKEIPKEPETIPPPPDPEPPIEPVQAEDSVAHINESSVKGEAGTGYESEDGKGEFECENCTYYEKDSFSCGQEDMMRMSKRPRVAGSNRVIVDPEGCCDYVDRKLQADKSYAEDKD